MKDRSKISRNNSVRGKDIERDWAHALGVQRIGPTGETGPDMVTGAFAVEIKSRLGFKGLVALMDATLEKGTAYPALTPVLGLTVRRGPGHPSRHLVVLERSDFIDWCVEEGDDDA